MYNIFTELKMVISCRLLENYIGTYLLRNGRTILFYAYATLFYRNEHA